MNFGILWRSTVFVVTLLLIYLAFPILIVPSSLPAIQEIVIEGSKPQPTPVTQPDYFGLGQDSVPIQQLSPATTLTLTEKIEELRQLHRQGMDLILSR